MSIDFANANANNNNTVVYTTVFLVTAGSYSDYRVLEAFLSEEKAKKFVEGKYGAEIEEYELEASASNDVYILWTGQYSDASIHNVYASKDEAEADAGGVYSPNIEEMEISDTLETIYKGKFPAGCQRWKVSFLGTTLSSVSVDNYCLEEWEQIYPWGDDKHYEYRVWARDEGHAIKIASEKLAHTRATEAFSFMFGG